MRFESSQVAVDTTMNNSDRTWPTPNHSHAMRMSWHDLLFAHWSFEPDRVARLLPDGIDLDTFEGKAWVGVVPFRMSNVAPRFVPSLPWMSAFPELNIRTYVTHHGKPGVWFFSLDATNPVAVRMARWLFHLRYMDAKMSLTKVDHWYQYRSLRTHRSEPSARLIGKYRPTSEPFFASPGSLEYWLTARYCLYVSDRRGRILRGEIDHPPWPLQQAELVLEENTMLDWLDLEAKTPPHLLFSKDVTVKAWLNQMA